MRQVLPEGAFEFYVTLGPVRSYDAVAQKFGVAKRTVVRTAKRENWKKRLAAIEADVRVATDKALVADLSEMRERHRKLLLAMASRAAKAISEHPLKSGMEGIRAGKLVIELERLRTEQRRDDDDDDGVDEAPVIIIS